MEGECLRKFIFSLGIFGGICVYEYKLNVPWIEYNCDESKTTFTSEATEWSGCHILLQIRNKSLEFHSWYLFTHNLSYDVYYNNFAQRQAEYHSAVLYKTELGLFHRKKCNRTPPSPPHPFTEMTRHFVCARPHIALSSRLEISGKISAKK